MLQRLHELRLEELSGGEKTDKSADDVFKPSVPYTRPFAHLNGQDPVDNSASLPNGFLDDSPDKKKVLFVSVLLYTTVCSL